MHISLQKALSFYLTGSLSEHNTTYINPCGETENLTAQELDDCETSEKEFLDAEINGYKFKDPTLNLKANLNTLTGQFRFAGMSTINSLFSGIGSLIAKKINLISGFGLAAAAFGASFIKDVPFLAKKFSILSLGANSMRGSLHILDSIFSRVGEEGAKYTLPSILAGGVSLFSAHRSITNKNNKSLSLSNNTISGILGRTSVHHIDSMLASKATEISTNHSEAGAFLATSLSTAGLLIPKNLRTHEMPWDSMEGFIGQGGSKFLDSLFASIGHSFNSTFNSTKKIALGTLGITAGLPLLGSLINSINYKIPFGTLEGRIVKGILNMPETVAFNLGDSVGNGLLGIPLSLGFAGLTYFTCFSNKGKNLIKNFEISTTSLGGELQRLPFLHFMNSVISASAMKLSNFIPAPLLTLVGPSLSFQMGEKVKNIPAKFGELKGLMLRNSVHIWDSILSRSAYKTATVFFGKSDDETYTGNVVTDGGSTYWLTEDGRKVSSMAIGKQLNIESQPNILNTIFAGLGGIGFSLGAFALGKSFMKGGNNEQARTVNHTIESKNIETVIAKPVSKEMSVNKERVMV